MQKMTQIDRQHLHAEMRQARANGDTIRAIAAKFGVHRCVAHSAVRDIEPQPPEPVSVHDLVCTPSGEYRPVFVVKTPFRRGGFRVIDGHYTRDVWGAK